MPFSASRAVSLRPLTMPLIMSSGIRKSRTRTMRRNALKVYPPVNAAKRCLLSLFMRDSIAEFARGS